MRSFSCCNTRFIGFSIHNDTRNARGNFKKEVLTVNFWLTAQFSTLVFIIQDERKAENKLSGGHFSGCQAPGRRQKFSKAFRTPRKSGHILYTSYYICLSGGHNLFCSGNKLHPRQAPDRESSESGKKTRRGTPFRSTVVLAPKQRKMHGYDGIVMQKKAKVQQKQQFSFSFVQICSLKQVHPAQKTCNL